jgi:GH25 family lysozyme M1 (1,4-beta-N-acetylmuramidase)
MSNRVFGADVSTYQRSDNVPGEPKPELLIDDESYVFVKSSQDNYIDPDFTWWYVRMIGKKPLSAYHFGNYMKAAQPQAQYFGNIIRQYPLDFQGVLDFEKTARYGELPAAYNCVQWCLDFGDEYKHQFGNWPIFYGNGSTVLYFMKSGHKRLSDLFEWPLWIAYPGPEEHIYKYKYLGGWDRFTFWQFTWNAPGYANGVETASLDYNYFNGDQAAFDKFIGKDVVEPPVTPNFDAYHMMALEAIEGMRNTR